MDVLCTNAGVYPERSLSEMTEQDLDSVTDPNLHGTVFSVQTCTSLLARSGRGRVVMISSITGPITGWPG